jgi:hypothetical protein
MNSRKHNRTDDSTEYHSYILSTITRNPQTDKRWYTYVVPVSPKLTEIFQASKWLPQLVTPPLPKNFDLNRRIIPIFRE